MVVEKVKNAIETIKEENDNIINQMKKKKTVSISQEVINELENMLLTIKKIV